MRFPTIHLNGTSSEALFERYKAASDALYEALRLLHETGPNGRDYYPQGGLDVLKAATEEHLLRVQRLSDVRMELLELAAHVIDAQEKREALKRR
jgi:hypothetical protein